METLTKLNEKQIKQVQALFAQYADKNYIKKSESKENVYIENVYTDYSDNQSIEEGVNELEEITEETIIEYTNNLIESYYEFDTDWEKLRYYHNEFISQYSEQLEEINALEYLKNENIFNLDDEIVTLEFDFDSYVTAVQGSTINTLVYLENANNFDYEFTNNNFLDFMQIYDIDDKEEKAEMLDALEDSSLNTLLNKLGYTMDQFINYYVSDETTDDKQLHSIYEEVLNMSNYCALVVLKKFTVEEYLKLKDSDTFIVEKGEELGYYNAFNGSGSMLEIELEKDITFNKGEFKFYKDGELGYTVTETYGRYF